MSDTPTSQRQGLWLLGVLATLLGFASISTDLYLPALPAMRAALGASQTQIELTVSGYLIGFCVGQLFWGPISDRYGRRGPIAIGLVIFVIGSVGCALSTGAMALIAWRVVQALGASAGVVLARAMVRDLYSRDQAARVLSTLMTVMAVAPLLGPIVGGQILTIAPWRAIFWALVAIGVATLAALHGVPETLPRERREASSLLGTVAAYGALLRNGVLLGYSAAGGFFYAGIFAYVAGTPFAYISYHHLLPQLYGVLFATGIVGVMAANIVNTRAVMRFGADRMLLIGASGATLFGILAAAAAIADRGGLAGLAAPLLLFVSMNGFIIANAVAGALASVPARVGGASAVIGAAQYGCGAIGAGLVGAFANGTRVPLSLVVAFAGIGSLASVLVAGRLRPAARD